MCVCFEVDLESGWVVTLPKTLMEACLDKKRDGYADKLDVAEVSRSRCDGDYSA